MNTCFIQQLARSVQLNAEQKHILVGLLLGDGHLETRTQGNTFRLKIEHSINQIDYVDWLYEKFGNIVLSSPKTRIKEVKGRQHQSYWFNTLSSAAFRRYGKAFYPDGKKIVPELIHQWVTPLSLAIWFMDDGSLKSQYHSARILNTQCFDAISLQRLQAMLVSRFGVQTTLRNQKEGQQLYIPSTDVGRFITIIRPYILPSMEYKI